jgi:2-polyprenyl-3-methyl-5-hydroxy-6-metoxy-1,4-benzoquinol methylase
MQQTYAEQYRELWNRHWWWRARQRFVLDWIRKIHRDHPIRQVLDIGCGDGLLFDQLSQFGEVQGIEPDARLISTEGRWRDRIEVTAFGSEYVNNRRFDLVLMLDVLEHIEDHLGALRKVHSLLNDDGMVLLTVPALPKLWSAHDVANCHFRRYTRATIGEALASTNLKPVRLQYFFGWTVLPLLLRRLISPGARNGRSDGEYSVRIPPRAVNGAFYWLSILEQSSAALGGVPLGTSIVAIAKRGHK